MILAENNVHLKNYSFFLHFGWNQYFNIFPYKILTFLKTIIGTSFHILFKTAKNCWKYNRASILLMISLHILSPCKSQFHFSWSGPDIVCKRRNNSHEWSAILWRSSSWVYKRSWKIKPKETVLKMKNCFVKVDKKKGVCDSSGLISSWKCQFCDGNHALMTDNFTMSFQLMMEAIF